MGMFDKVRRENCCEYTDSEYEQELIADEIKLNFKSMPNYMQVYKNLDELDIYDALIVEQTKRTKTIGQKNLISYPYPTPKFSIGDYLSFYDAGDNLSHWLVESLDTFLYFNVNGLITKTNNYFKFVDESGNVYNYPCVVKEKLVLSGFSGDMEMDTPEGRFEILLQLNEDTVKIKEDVRCVMNNMDFQSSEYGIQAIKVTNYVNMSEPKLLKLYVVKDQINELLDDLPNLIADKYKNNYNTIIQQDNFSQQIGYTDVLDAIVTLNGDELDDAVVVWESSDEAIATVNQTGSIELLSIGQVIITARYSEAELVHDSVTIDVVAVLTNIKENRIEPIITELLQDSNEVYTVYKYIDNVKQADTFTVSTSSVPEDYYNLTIINGNTFRIDNIKAYVDNVLIVQCVNNVDASVELIEIKLKGFW